MRTEPWLLKPYRTKEILQRYGIRMQKKFGQNFLIDAHVLEKIIAAADISEQDLVIEIGPGIGTLTQYLCYAAGRAAAIEIDRHLLPVLEETLADWDNVEVISGDVMKLDLRDVIRNQMEKLEAAVLGADEKHAQDTAVLGVDAKYEQDTAVLGVDEKHEQDTELLGVDEKHAQDTEILGADEKHAQDVATSDRTEQSAQARPAVRVVANLPYYITTPILMKLLEEDLPIASITVMVQKEVADRMQASPGTPEFSALSLAVQYYAEPHLAAIVPPNCFVPRPNVDSAVIHLTRRDPGSRVRVNNPDHMFRLIRAAFAQRRKTLVNALRNAADLRKADGSAYTREEAEEALTACGFDLNVRGEKLGLEEYAALSNLLDR